MRFVDLAPAEIYATLLEEGRNLCSERTFYRNLGAHDEVRERRDELRHPVYQKLELLATGPSWDITKLLGPVKWTYFYPYMLLDVFSRYMVGWLLAQRESAALAERLIAERSEPQGIASHELTLQLFGRLGVTKSHSRPHTSSDNRS